MWKAEAIEEVGEVETVFGSNNCSHKFSLGDTSAQDTEELCLSSDDCATQCRCVADNRLMGDWTSAAGSIGAGADMKGVIRALEVGMNAVFGSVAQVQLEGQVVI